MLTCFRELPGPSGFHGRRLGAGARSSGSWDLCSPKAHLWGPVGHGASLGSRPFWLVVDAGQRPGQGFRAVPVEWLPLQCGEGMISWQLRECMLGERPVVRLVLSEAQLCLRYLRWTQTWNAKALAQQRAPAAPALAESRIWGRWPAGDEAGVVFGTGQLSPLPLSRHLLDCSCVCRPVLFRRRGSCPGARHVRA